LALSESHGADSDADFLDLGSFCLIFIDEIGKNPNENVHEQL